MIPLSLDLMGRRVLIFGGGKVAERKAAYFGREADVIVASRSHSKAMENLPVQRIACDVEKATDEELRELITNAFIVVAALPGRDLNNRIGKICREAGILFNNAGGEYGDLIVPAVSSGKGYTIAVTTDGTSPAVSRYIREEMDARFPGLDGMIALQESLRRDLRKRELSQAKRSAILGKVIRDPEIWDALSSSPAEAEAIARRKHLDV